MRTNTFDCLTRSKNISVKETCIALFLLFSLPFHSFSQSDTTAVKHSPKKAIIMSACVPGLGQVYNKKYWKVPVIYAGVAAVTYFAILNSDSLKLYSDAYKQRMDGDSTTIDPFINKYSPENLLQIKNYYRRNLELTVIVAAGIYILNIIDAAVDANLFDFNVDENLSVRISPAVFSSAGHYTTGLSFSFNIKQPKKKIHFH